MAVKAGKINAWLIAIFLIYSNASHNAQIDFVNYTGKPILITMYLSPKGYHQFEMGVVYMHSVNMNAYGFDYMSLIVVDDLATLESSLARKEFQRVNLDIPGNHGTYRGELYRKNGKIILKLINTYYTQAQGTPAPEREIASEPTTEWLF